MAEGYFFPGENLPLRQRIALAILARRNKFPTTLGEGLSAVGESIGDIMTERRLLGADKQAQEEARQLLGVPEAPQAPAAPSAYSPPARTSSTGDITTPPVDVTTPGGAGEGTPMDYGGAYNPLDQAADLQQQRKPYAAQLEADPAAKLKMAALMRAEEGGGAANSTARQALAETIFNRGISRGVSNVNQVMDPRYYQPMMPNQTTNRYSDHLAKVQNDPAERARLFSEIDQVAGGTNISNLATDNASGDVAARSMGNQTLTYKAPNDESFFRKDVRPDVHGAGVVPATAAWAQGLATAPPVDTSQRPPVMAFSGEPQDGAVPFNAQNFLPMASPNAPPAGAAAATSAPPPQITQAPPPPIRQAPPIAQATAAVPGYVAKEMPEPQAPPPSMPSQRELELKLVSQRNPHATPLYEQMKSQREQQAARQVEAYKDQLQTVRAHNLEVEKQRASAAERGLNVRKGEAEISSAQEASALKSRLGGRDPEKFFTDFNGQKTAAIQSENVRQQSALARDAIKNGVVTGFGADARVNKERLQAWMLNNKVSGDLASNSEMLLNATKSMVTIALQNMQAGDTRVSEGDIKVASGQTGADLSLQLQTIQKIINNNERIANERIGTFEDQRDYYLGGTRAEKMYEIPTKPVAPDKYVDVLMKHKDDDQARKDFDERFGHGAATLAIERAKRRQRRGE